MSIKNRITKWSIGAIHPTNYGDLVILERFPKNVVKVRFLYTGTELLTRITGIAQGTVKDPNLPIVYGAGYFGQGKYKAKIKGKMTSSYKCWAGILDRCHGKDKAIKAPTYKDVTIEPSWYNYQVFAEWFYTNRPKDYKEVRYELDKDILSGKNKKYSPDTCSFVTRQANVEAAWAKHYEFISPDGEVVFVYNLSKFCRGKNLTTAHMSRVYSGKLNAHKGWTRHKGDSDEK